MDTGAHKVIITGDVADATAALLRERLDELEKNVAITVHAVSDVESVESDTVFEYTLGAHDTPGFAVEKIIDELCVRGWANTDACDLSPEEEAQIRARLQGLGYVD